MEESKPKKIGGHALGKSVRILSGPFAGCTGYIANVQRNDDKPEVDVAIFQRRKFIEVSVRDIELLDFKSRQ